MSRRTKEAETISRREFLKGSAVAAGTAIAWPTIVPSSVFGAAPTQKAAQTPDPITGAESAEGFGVNKGGLGGEEVVVTTFDELAKAIKCSNVYIKVKGDLIATGKATIGSSSNLTIDGGGAATL